MKLKDSIIIILVFIVAVALGIFAGVKITERKQENNKVNQGDIVDDNKNNNVNQDNNISNKNDENTSNDKVDVKPDNGSDSNNNANSVSNKEKLEDYLKENNISYVDPKVKGKHVFDNNQQTSNNFTLGTKKAVIKLSDDELFIQLDNIEKEIATIPDYSWVDVYTYNNYLLIYKQFSGSTSSISVYDSSLNKLISVDSDDNGSPLFSENNIYYGERDCNGPGMYGNLAVYKFNLDTKVKTFTVYLEHLAGWAC